jgi:subtilisin family serine protease
MPSPKSTVQFILLPMRDQRSTADGPELARLFRSLSRPGLVQAGEAGAVGLKMTVLDSIGEDGAKLVEMPLDAVPALRRLLPAMRFVPVCYYRTALAPRVRVTEAPSWLKAGPRPKVRIKVVSSGDGRPVPKAIVVAFTDFNGRVGAEGTTDRQGYAELALDSDKPLLDRLYVYPHMGYWGTLRMSLRLTAGTEIPLTPVDLAYEDSLRHFRGPSEETDGSGLRIGVIDTGVGPHPDLVVEGGRNTVPGEEAGDFEDNGAQHGTHVGGIIAARGRPPAGLRGVAPAAALRSYRVFGKKSESASNYAIAKAIDAAAADGCDLINMSLGGGGADEAIRGAIEDARARGALIFAAAGNEDRSPVSFPASDPLALAVSAMGRKGTFPAQATESGDVASPWGTDKKNFVAAFSNVGPEVDLTGPGVGIISTVPGGYAVMSGTSMACPAATGLAARLLAGKHDILGRARDRGRSEAMAQFILTAARPLGFGATFEGQGLLP